MPEPTDRNAAEQIHAEYIETLARAQRAADLKYYPQRGDGTPREDWEVMPDWRRRQYLDSVVPFVDALAEAGLLPIAVDARYIGRGEQRRTRYVTEWQDPPNCSEIPNTSPPASGGQAKPMQPRPHIGTSEVAQ